MNIITISREFGSGGRELGKRLSDLLKYDYYDKEIITAIANKQGLDANYVENSLDNNSWSSFPLSFGTTLTGNLTMSTQTNLLVAQTDILQDIANIGKNCVIVGRNADVILEKYYPLRIFVCADIDSKIDRCISRSTTGEDISRKRIEHEMRRIDKNRATAHEIISSETWGNKTSYDLIVNTTNWDIKSLSKALIPFVKAWLEKA